MAKGKFRTGYADRVYQRLVDALITNGVVNVHQYIPVTVALMNAIDEWEDEEIRLAAEKPVARKRKPSTRHN